MSKNNIYIMHLTLISQYSNGFVASSFSEQFKILNNNFPSCNNATSSIDIDNIAISNNQPTNMQMQSLSAPLAQHPIFTVRLANRNQ